MQPHLIPPKDVPYIWPEVAHLINKGLSHSNGEIDAESFFLPIYTGQQYLWLGIEEGSINSVLVCEVLKYQLRWIEKQRSAAVSQAARMPAFFEHANTNLPQYA